MTQWESHTEVGRPLDSVMAMVNVMGLLGYELVQILPPQNDSNYTAILKRPKPNNFAQDDGEEG